MSDLKLTPSSTAAVFIDLQPSIIGMGPKPNSPDSVIANARKIADKLRAAGGTVVWVHVDFNHLIELDADTPMKRPAEPLPQAVLEVVPETGIQPTDIQIFKKHWGAFAGTDLEQQLRAGNIKTVILGGIASDIGVESTLRQGTGLGFNFVTVEDATSALAAEGHAYVFKNTFPRLSRVSTTADVLDALS